MADENETAGNNNTMMNLDLNLEPGSVAAREDIPINLDDWSDDSPDRLREAVRHTGWQHQRRRRWLSIENHQTESENLTMNLSQLLTSVAIQRRGLHMGEGSVAAEERVAEVEKICEDKVVVVEDAAMGNSDDDEKVSDEEGSFYDCNICFELAKDPVITCCGHLYCWPCIYRWLHIHSDSSDCPVCKGEITMNTVTPIYGRGLNKGVPEEDLTIRIPPRPPAKRVESRQMNDFTMPVEEMIRRLGSRFDLTRDFSAAQEMANSVNLPDRNPSHFLNRIMTTRAMRREQNVANPVNVVDLTESEAASPDTAGNTGLQLHARVAQRRARNRSNDTSIRFPSSMTVSERVIDFEAYIRNHPMIPRRSEQSPLVDDRDSFSSIAAGVHSGSQNMDTAVEIDSAISLSVSASSSRRRIDASRASDVDSGDSRPPRRRRLN